MSFQPKSFQQIVADMAAKVAAETPITDFTPGSVILTLLEAAAQEDFAQYVQMVEAIRGYNLDTTSGSDLDTRAAEYGLSRKQAAPHSGFVTIWDSRFTKKFTKLYAGLAGPTASTFILKVDDASSFPASGSLYIGRGTANTEGPIAYSTAPVNNTSYWTITLDTALVNDHGTDETVILAQFGTRTITAGTEVIVAESDFSDELAFELNQGVQLLDGEDTVENTLVTATTPGGFQVPSKSIAQFSSNPFTGARVENPLPFVNGRDQETDQELRDRIRDTIQSLSRGTQQSIQSGILGLIDEGTNSSVVSANIIPPVVLADGPTRVYIDNGRGLEPEIAGTGEEIVVTQATGGEQFAQLENFPLIKANAVSQNVEPFSLVGLETLIYNVGTDEETFTFLASDITTSGAAQATELAEAINNRASLIEARTITESSGIRLIIWSKRDANESLKINSASTAQTALNFIEREIFTLKLYKNDQLLTKDGLTANITSEQQPYDISTSVYTTSDGDITVAVGSRLVTKTVAGLDAFKEKVFKGDYIKFSSDSDAFYSQVQAVISDTKFILEEGYPALGGGLGDITIWHSAQLEISANGDILETEVASFGPNDFGSASQALANEVLTRLQEEIQLTKTQLEANETKIKVISLLDNSLASKVQITGGGASISLGFCAAAPITGTVTVSANEQLVTGAGTVFTSELQEGQWIKVSTDGKASWTKIDTIENDTILYLSEGYRGPSSAGGIANKIGFSQVAQGADKDYTLNRFNGQIEFEELLSAGDMISVGSSNTRAFQDSLQETFDFDSIGASSNLIVCVDGGFIADVTTGDASAPYDTFSATTLADYEPNFFVGFFVRWTSGNNLNESSYIMSYNELTGAFQTTSGFTNPVVLGDKLQLCQNLEFIHATDFSDPQAATAIEVAAAINNQILGGAAQVLSTDKVRIRTNNYETGSLEILGGTANAILLLNTEAASSQEANVAFVTSRNSDREGLANALGFTTGPKQNLVVILDNDPALKTFSIPVKIDGTVTGTALGIFSASALGSIYSTGFFKGFWIHWLTGSNTGYLQTADTYIGVTGTFTYTDIFPSGGLNPIAIGDTFSLTPRTAESFKRLTEDTKTTTFSLLGSTDVIGISGDFIQLASNTSGSAGKVHVTGGTCNSIGIVVDGILAGSPINDLQTSSVAGLSKGLPVYLTVDCEVTTGDLIAPYDTFISTVLVSALPSYFNGLEIEFLTGDNAGHVTTVTSYNNATGGILLTDATEDSISLGDTFRIKRLAFIKDLINTSAPYNVQLVDITNALTDVSGYTTDRLSAIRDVNGLNFVSIQREGIDGYKYLTGLLQRTQWTIDGLDRDRDSYPGIGAAGTQFEVLPPVLVKLVLTLDITTEEGISLSSVGSLISSAVASYVNTRGVGEDVILSEVVAAAQSVDGVFDVEVSSHTENIIAASNELIRIDSADLIIG